MNACAETGVNPEATHAQQQPANQKTRASKEQNQLSLLLSICSKNCAFWRLVGCCEITLFLPAHRGLLAEVLRHAKCTCFCRICSTLVYFLGADYFYQELATGNFLHLLFDNLAQSHSITMSDGHHLPGLYTQDTLIKNIPT